MRLLSAPSARPTVAKTPIHGCASAAVMAIVTTASPAATRTERRRLAAASTWGASTGCTFCSPLNRSGRSLGLVLEKLPELDDGVTDAPDEAEGETDENQYGGCSEHSVQPPSE